MPECRPSRVARYRGMRKPRCNGGAGCEACWTKYRRRQLWNRFWSKVDKSAGCDGCWPWIGAVVQGRKGGYGKFKLDGKAYRAHRVAYMLWNELEMDETPALLRHKCDNRLCCAPHHLEPGTHSDNVQDALARGRWRNQHTGKLTCEAA